MSSRRIELSLDPQVAWLGLLEVASSLGKVEETSEASKFLMLKMRYGMNPVRLRVSLLSGSDGRSSVVEIQARGQDVMGVASRKCIDKLCMAMERIPSPPLASAPIPSDAPAPPAGATRFCAQCGGGLAESARFCPQCGTQICSLG